MSDINIIINSGTFASVLAYYARMAPVKVYPICSLFGIFSTHVTYINIIDWYKLMHINLAHLNKTRIEYTRIIKYNVKGEHN